MQTRQPDRSKPGRFFSASIPHPITFGAELRYGSAWGTYLSYGNFSYSPAATSKIQDLDINIRHYEAVGSWFPWEDVFHLDAGLGQQTIAVKAVSRQEFSSSTATASTVGINAKFDIKSTYLYAGTGWTWRWSFGLNVGTGLGLQLPMSSSSSFSAQLEDSATLDEAFKSTSAYREFEDAVKKAGKKAGMLALPRIELIRIGWLF